MVEVDHGKIIEKVFGGKGLKIFIFIGSAQTLLAEGNGERVGKVDNIVATGQALFLAGRALNVHYLLLSTLQAIEVVDMTDGGIAIDQRQVEGYAVAQPVEILSIAFGLTITTCVVSVKEQLLLITENALAFLPVDGTQAGKGLETARNDTKVGLVAQHNGQARLFESRLID